MAANAEELAKRLATEARVLAGELKHLQVAQELAAEERANERRGWLALVVASWGLTLLSWVRRATKKRPTGR